MLGSVQLFYALHADGRRACALNLRAHFVQEIGKISDFRLAGAVLQNGFALGQSCGHEQIFSACDRDFVKDNFGAFQPLGCGFNESMFLLDIRPEALESFDMKVDWAGADGATARQRDTGALAAGEQRAKNERGGPHRFYNFVGYFRRERTSAADSGAMVRATEAQLHFRSHCSQQLALGLYIPHLRNVLQNHRLFGEQSGGHGRQRCIFGPADTDRPQQRVPAADYEFIHTQKIPVMPNP